MSGVHAGGCRLIQLVVLLLLTLFAWENAAAQQVTFEISGHISLLSDPYEFLVGEVGVEDPFTGTFTYDLRTPNSLWWEEHTGWYVQPSSLGSSGLSITVGGITIRSDGSLPVDIVVDNDADVCGVREDCDSFHMRPWSATVTGAPSALAEPLLSISMIDAGGTALDSHDLPRLFDARDWNEATIQFWAVAAGGNDGLFFSGTIESIRSSSMPPEEPDVGTTAPTSDR
jgi:hypothetical protein